MRQSIKAFVAVTAQTLPLQEPIYEFGSLQVVGQEGFADLRPLFPNKEYVGADMREGVGVDKVLNLHAIDLPSESVGTVLCLDTLEHVEYPRQALGEIYRILKPNGVVIISSEMCFPIHNHPFDYWRFTPQGFASLLNHFVNPFIGFAGHELFPHTIIGIGFKNTQPSLIEFTTQYHTWQANHFWAYRAALKWFVQLIVPAKVLLFFVKLYRLVR